MSRPRLVGIGLSVVVALATATAARASVYAEAVPSKMAVDGKAEQVVTREVLVANLGDEPLVVGVRLSDWEISESGDVMLRAFGSTPHSLADCLTFEPREFSLGAHESRSIHVRIRVPGSGVPTRSGVLLSEVRSATPRPLSFGPRINAELGTTFYVSRAPASDVRAEINDLRIEPVGRDSIRIRCRVRNSGQHHFYVSGRCALTRLDGAELASENVGNGVVLPDAVREFSWMTRAGMEPGRYLAVATLDTGSPELMVGELPFDWPLPPRIAPSTIASGSR
jgi:hypothetical protein